MMYDKFTEIHKHPYSRDYTTYSLADGYGEDSECILWDNTKDEIIDILASKGVNIPHGVAFEPALVKHGYRIIRTGFDKTAYNADMEKYYADFKTALFIYHGVQDNKKAQDCYEAAEILSSDNDLRDLARIFGVIVSLIK